MKKNTIIETKFNGKIWIDITNPTPKKLYQLQAKYNLHSADIKECIDEILISKTYEHHSYLFIVIHSSQINHLGDIEFDEFDIFLSRRFIITLHKKPYEYLEEISNILTNTNPQNGLKINTFFILYKLINHITEINLSIINQVIGQIKDIEKSILKENTQDPISKILFARKLILQIKAITKPNQVVTKEIINSNIIRNYPSYKVYFDSIAELQEKTINVAKHYLDLVDGLTDISTILSNKRLNNIMRTLTIKSVSLLPPTLMAGIFGMNFREFGLFDHSQGFYIVIIAMIIIEIAIINYFKYKKWL